LEDITKQDLYLDKTPQNQRLTLITWINHELMVTLTGKAQALWGVFEVREPYGGKSSRIYSSLVLLSVSTKFIHILEHRLSNESFGLGAADVAPLGIGMFCHCRYYRIPVLVYTGSKCRLRPERRVVVCRPTWFCINIRLLLPLTSGFKGSPVLRTACGMAIVIE
jgi:hypothetical protein